MANSKLFIPGDVGDVSDGYHTFNELYEHRQLLFVALCNSFGSKAWKSKRHSDGTTMAGWFIAGLTLPTIKDISYGEVTYHLEHRFWDLLKCEEFEKGKPWDGHTSQDVIQRFWDWLEDVAP